MSTTLFLILCLNGLQYGMLLFLIAAGLTLVFGVMGFINLAHGVQYMVGAYLVYAYVQLTGSFIVAVFLSLGTALIFGLLLEFFVFRHLYTRSHLDQVLATFGIIIFLNELAKVVFGPATLSVAPPEFLAGSIQLTETLRYPVYRFATIIAGLAVAAVLYFTISYTRIGMLIRAGATSAEMVSALGVNIQRLFMIVFGVGAMLAGFAGVIAAPIFAIEPGMGDNILIVTFVVIIIGGIGSIGGAFIAALLVGLIDTLGRSFATEILSTLFSPSFANQIGPALASMLIYILMAAILVFRPKGLLPAKGVA
ncbi:MULTISPECIES: branched-chain amino acid ABC transporter permease [Sulfitobacter]|uniref:High-affinity branched-chain amino acid transport system permease protein LivH n=1 Tax=Sulfitobacter dubius TaxID=218673 RepID=A0ABY3ZMC2_9RHOB|nr:branched-chain amino acid ABC transporter permease [Sulfitobacter dubius]MBM06019.1 branched-chain amino acid ABC transporter permease [Sulfitobacter sp.]UOA15827.1 High-affinity branched-chain amino acid transport system permease protein LivH [Sulfitobacter dubius]WOI28783.1 branched-chain amino acid ABC transporter permease [Sulfitobacter dubius]SFH15609.1 amino acid/amide ABC transporter membrane protein 1, HAAT family (TC 3.A.1.4.-) [Sulfitobacter dubius]